MRDTVFGEWPIFNGGQTLAMKKKVGKQANRRDDQTGTMVDFHR